MAGIQNTHRTIAAGGGSSSQSRWSLVAGEQSTSATGWVTVGAAWIDPSLGSSSLTLHAVLECSDAAHACKARLYNQTDGVAVAGVAGELTQPATSPTDTQLAITAGVTIGCPNAARLYLMQIQMDGGSLPNMVACKGAYIQQ